MREAGKADEVVAVSLGVQQCQETIRTALAMGADRGILVRSDCGARAARGREADEGAGSSESSRDWSSPASSRSTATTLQTGQMLAAMLGWPQGTFAYRIEIDGGEMNLTREIDGGLETIKLRMPAVVTTDLRLNEPRFASLPNIMRAKKKPIDTFTSGGPRRRHHPRE